MRNSDEKELIRIRIKWLIDQGHYDQNELFNTLYPTWNRHYSELREIIAEVKND